MSLISIVPSNQIASIPNAHLTAYAISNGARIPFVNINGAIIAYDVYTNSSGFISVGQTALTGVYVNESANIVATDADTEAPIAQWSENIDTPTPVYDSELKDWMGNTIFSANASYIGQIPAPEQYYKQNVQEYAATAWNDIVNVTADTSILHCTCTSTANTSYTVTLQFIRDGQQVLVVNDSAYTLIVLNTTDPVPAPGGTLSGELSIPANSSHLIGSVTINGTIKFFG